MKKSVAYWATTALLAFCIGSGGLAELLGVQATVEGMARLGYPAYFVSTIGFWKFFGAIALLVPRFPRLKEWAYAGIFFNMTGAAVSNLATVAEPGHFIVEVVFVVLTVTSWALRPESRKLLGAPGDQVAPGPRSSVTFAEAAS